MTEEETAQKLAVLLENELGFDVDPEKLPDALRRAVHRLRIEAWRGACFAFMGADRAEAGR